MEWYDDQPRLKLTGHQSAEEVEEVFASSMVDVAYVVEVVDDAVFIVADDDAWPVDTADFEWLCGITRDILASYGIIGIELVLVPSRKLAQAEPGSALTQSV